MTLGVVTATFGVYLLIAVLAYFVSYTEDVAALEGAPSAVPLHNPTGWVGARLAHWLVYRGFGWIGVLFPLLLTYMGIRWVQGRPVKRVYLLFGLAALYFFSTLGAVLAQIGLVEDLLWCGVVGAAFADLLVLYIGKVGLLLSWGLLVGGVGYFFWRLRKRQTAQVMASAPESAPDAPSAESLAEEPTSEAAEPDFFFTIRPLAEPAHETTASDAGETWSASAQPSESISFLADKESAASVQPLASIPFPADKEGTVPDEGGLPQSLPLRQNLPKQSP
jgi:hypothetical protein